MYPKILDSLIKDSLSEQKKIGEVEEDRNQEKIQKGLLNIMGSLSQIWMGVNSMKDSTSSEVQFKGFTQTAEQTIVLVGQAAHSITS